MNGIDHKDEESKRKKVQKKAHRDGDAIVVENESGVAASELRDRHCNANSSETMEEEGSKEESAEVGAGWKCESYIRVN